MKKLLFLTIALVVSVSAFSQTQFKFGITGAMNASNLPISFPKGMVDEGLDLNLEQDYKIGFNAGFIGELAFTNGLYGNFSILYSNKGTKGASSYYEEYYDELAIMVPKAGKHVKAWEKEHQDILK